MLSTHDYYMQKLAEIAPPAPSQALAITPEKIQASVGTATYDPDMAANMSWWDRLKGWAIGMVANTSWGKSIIHNYLDKALANPLEATKPKGGIEGYIQEQLQNPHILNYLQKDDNFRGAINGTFKEWHSKPETRAKFMAIGSRPEVLQHYSTLFEPIQSTYAQARQKALSAIPKDILGVDDKTLMTKIAPLAKPDIAAEFAKQDPATRAIATNPGLAKQDVYSSISDAIHHPINTFNTARQAVFDPQAAGNAFASQVTQDPTTLRNFIRQYPEKFQPRYEQSVAAEKAKYPEQLSQVDPSILKQPEFQSRIQQGLGQAYDAMGDTYKDDAKVKPSDLFFGAAQRYLNKDIK